MPKDLLDHFRIVDEANPPHQPLADRLLRRVDRPSLANQCHFRDGSMRGGGGERGGRNLLFDVSRKDQGSGFEKMGSWVEPDPA